MAARKGLFRLAILILLIPVGLLLVLHFFGENRMDVQVMQSLKSCDLPDGTKVLLGGFDLDASKTNQLTRIEKMLEKKKVEILKANSECFTDTVAIYLVDKHQNLRGSYLLEQNEVNRLFAELDIVVMQDNYGESVSR